MRKRSKAREFALQRLYQKEITQDAPNETFSIEDAEIRHYTDRLVAHTNTQQQELDQKIEACADHWKLSRMAAVDRNILRLAACEILYFEDIPTKVAINEAIELAKKFGDSESPRFVNGVLDKLAKDNEPA